MLHVILESFKIPGIILRIGSGLSELDSISGQCFFNISFSQSMETDSVHLTALTILT